MSVGLSRRTSTMGNPIDETMGRAGLAYALGWPVGVRSCQSGGFFDLLYSHGANGKAFLSHEVVGDHRCAGRVVLEGDGPVDIMHLSELTFHLIFRP